MVPSNFADTWEVAVPPIRLAQALEQIEAARTSSLQRLADLREDEWFVMPGGISHIAWQAGHLAFAEYRMCVVRIRGEGEDDAAILPPEYFTLFGAATTAVADPSKYPTPGELIARLQIVHTAAMECCRDLTDADLDTPCQKPHPLFNTKLGSLLWCSRHEMMHAGQIGLLRRLLGKKPMW